MKALEKINILIEAKKNDSDDSPYWFDIITEENKWQPGEIESLTKNHPWLPKFYLDFIKEYDSISIAWTVFFGSAENNVLTLKDEIEYWGEHLNKGYFPISNHPSGGTYILNKTGNVMFFEREDFEWENEPQFIANDLEEFIGECLVGKRYLEFGEIEDDRFHLFLKDQGWA